MKASSKIAIVTAVTADLLTFPALCADNVRDVWKYISVTSTADLTNIYGNPWDGFNNSGMGTSIFFFMPNISSPPDLAICVVMTEDNECYYKEINGKPESYCYDSFDCGWTIRVPEDGDFGLVIYDLDTAIDPRFSDLVDSVVIKNGNDGDEDEISKKTNDLIKILSLTGFHLSNLHNITFNPGEERRRARDLSVFLLDECASGCRLQQSILQISPAPGS